MSSPYNYNNNNYTYSYNNNNNNNNNPNNNNNVNQPAENHQHSNPSPFPPAAFPAPPSAPTATPPANNNNNKANFDIQSHYYNMYNNNHHPPPANNHPPNKFTVEGGIEDNPQVLPPTYLAREEVAQQTAREAERHYQQTLQQGGLPPPPSATSQNNNNNGRQRLLFVPRSPRYTYRLLFLLAVAFCGALPLLHPLNWMILLTCFIAVYIADFIGSAKATVTLLLSFIVLFGASLVITNYSIVVRSVGPMLMIVDLTFLLFTACAAACLHFRFIQVEYPLVTFLLERVALVVMPLLVLPPSLAMCIALGGSRYAPAYFFGIMCLEHYFFYGPLKSSFLYQRLYHLEEPTERGNPNE
ncbi:hypothetical protein ADEAN_000356600 [Angomonas deanei]|uniref:Uncharacterized protein n=1 Tax=Angomonas deanei TaxID=59799 RepID=A0A7G2C9H7_9TRYP|nr:hypothetical protein ADEAN_000356600 [Angomonas deanei]